MSLKNIFHTVLICTLLPLLAACASGPTYKDLSAKEAPPAANMARVYVYRTGSMFGAAVQPSVKLDGQKVGTRSLADISTWTFRQETIGSALIPK